MNEKDEEVKRTLMNSYERLQSKARALGEVAEMSARLIAKFERTEDLKKEGDDCKKVGEADVKRDDIIDLFNNIAQAMELKIEIIANNLTRAINMVD